MGLEIYDDLFVPHNGLWFINGSLWNVEWDQNRKWWCVTRVFQGVLTDFSLSSCDVSLVNGNSGKEPEVIVFLLDGSRI